MLSTPRFTTLQDWLTWQEGLHPSAIELKLERIRQVAERLNVLCPAAKVITVAGTNGKGSCVATLVDLIQATGKRVAAYTSPHILRYNERIQINGTPVMDEALCEAFHAIDSARGDISLTYFEFGTLAAFYLFQQTQLDYWVLEVGLGGRLDATNVVDADVAIITSIDIDHKEWLGDTRELIGVEKAGICRQGKPVIIADPEPPQSVLDTVKRIGAVPHIIGEAFNVDDMSVPANGGLPPWSVAAAVYTLRLLGDLDDQARSHALLAERLPKLRLAGRWQEITFKGNKVILDVAHNPAAIKYLASKIAVRFSNKGVRLVLGMMADKDHAQTLDILSPYVQHAYLCDLPKVPRAARAETLAAAAGNVPYTTHCSAESAFNAAISGGSHEQDGCPIVVTGSFYTVAGIAESMNQQSVDASIDENRPEEHV